MCFVYESAEILNAEKSGVAEISEIFLGLELRRLRDPRVLSMLCVFKLCDLIKGEVI